MSYPDRGEDGLYVGSYRGEITNIPGLIAIGVMATLSALSIISLLIYVAHISIRYWRTPRPKNGMPKEDAQMRFLSTQFGFLFLNLLVADLIQVVGFILMYHWLRLGYIETGAACTIQALGIQTGDGASSLFALAIAIHTASILAFRYKPSQTVLYISAAIIWVVVIFLSVLGPTVIAADSRGPFYGRAGPWCFIDPEYSSAWVWLHYFFVFLAAFGTVVMYGIVFFSVTQMWPFALLAPNRPPKRFNTFHIGKNNPVGAPPAQENTLKVNVRDLPSFPAMERTAKKMLGYPIVFTCLVLPLSACRLASFSGREVPSNIICFAGFMMATCGLADVCLFLFSRGFLTFSKGKFSSGSHKPYELFITSVHVHTIQTTMVDQIIPQPSRRPRYVDPTLRSKDGHSITSIDLELEPPKKNVQMDQDNNISDQKADLEATAQVFFPPTNPYHNSPTQ